MDISLVGTVAAGGMDSSRPILGPSISERGVHPLLAHSQTSGIEMENKKTMKKTKKVPELRIFCTTRAEPEEWRGTGRGQASRTNTEGEFADVCVCWTLREKAG